MSLGSWIAYACVLQRKRSTLLDSNVGRGLLLLRYSVHAGIEFSLFTFEIYSATGHGSTASVEPDCHRTRDFVTLHFATLNGWGFGVRIVKKNIHNSVAKRHQLHTWNKIILVVGVKRLRWQSSRFLFIFFFNSFSRLIFSYCIWKPTVWNFIFFFYWSMTFSNKHKDETSYLLLSLIL